MNMTFKAELNGAAPDTDTPALKVENLRTQFFTDDGIVTAVDGVSFTVAQGEALGIVGESGSGKSVTALSLMRLLDEPARITAGEVHFQGKDVLAMNPEELRAVRGDRMAMVFQDPMTSLNPVLKIAKQLVETMVVHGRFTPEQAGKRAVGLLGRMGVTAPERAVESYPHQFSGGMRQRVMLALGMSNEPALLIADEPTTALDVTIQAQILDLIRELNRDFGTSVVLISHDLGVIARVCRRTIVMYGGEVVEEGLTEDLLADPRHPYTWALINAVPRIDEVRPSDRRLTTIEGQPPDPFDLPKGCRFAPRCPFRIEKCDSHPDLAEVAPGRKSRCWVTQAGTPLPKKQRHAKAEAEAKAKTEAKTEAKAATPRVIAGRDEAPLLSLRDVVKHFPLPKTGYFQPRRAVHAVDNVDLDVFRGETVGLVGESGCGKSTLARVVMRIHQPDSGEVVFAGQDIARSSQKQIRPLRRRLQMVFQDPYGSLNTVGLNPRVGRRYSYEFSGGQRQRISIARALAVEPDFIVADEPISALDVNIQAQIINLMLDLQEKYGLTYLFIAHDLAVVRHISDRVVVLYLGKVMEIAPADQLFDRPLHPYTRYLLSAVPIPDAVVERERGYLKLDGEPPSSIEPPSGCRFRTRCPLAKEICASVPPPLVEHAPGHVAACHFAGQLQ